MGRQDTRRKTIETGIHCAHLVLQFRMCASEIAHLTFERKLPFPVTVHLPLQFEMFKQSAYRTFELTQHVANNFCQLQQHKLQLLENCN